MPPRRFPTLENLRAACAIYEAATAWRGTRAALVEAFQCLPSHHDPRHVVAKVVLVNDLYSARLPRQQRTVSAHLTSDAVLSHARPSAAWVDAIARAPVTVKDRPYYLRSFASKYAHFHFPQDVPIYDSKVAVALKALGSEPIPDRDYPAFARIIESFREGVRGRLRDEGCSPAVVAEHTSWERLDAYLWLFGHLCEFRAGKSLAGLNKEVKELYADPKCRLHFDALEPPPDPS